jgi:hypothetical protein
MLKHALKDRCKQIAKTVPCGFQNIGEALEIEAECI